MYRYVIKYLQNWWLRTQREEFLSVAKIVENHKSLLRVDLTDFSER